MRAPLQWMGASGAGRARDSAHGIGTTIWGERGLMRPGLVVEERRVSLPGLLVFSRACFSAEARLGTTEPWLTAMDTHDDEPTFTTLSRRPDDR